MSYCVVSVVILGNNWLEEIEKILETLSEELWLYLCYFIEFYEDILKNSLIILIESLDSDLCHEWDDIHEFSSVFTFSYLQEVGYSLKCCKIDI